MEKWILIAVAAYLLLAFESIANKILITGRVKSWRLFLFYIGLLSFSSLIFAPLGLAWPGWKIFLLALLSGGLFYGYLAFLFSSLKGSAASRVFVLVGAVSTVVTLFFSNIFLGEDLTLLEVLGSLVLVLGGILISFKFYKGRFFSGWKKVVVAGFFYAISLIAIKYVYDLFGQLHGNSLVAFVNGYIYSRMGIVLMTLIALAIPSYRNKISQLLRDGKKKEHTSNFGAVIGIKTLSGVATFLLNYSISIGSVAIVSALESVRYLFVFLLSIIFAKFVNNWVKENTNFSNTIGKFIGVILVIIGVILVSLFK